MQFQSVIRFAKNLKFHSYLIDLFGLEGEVGRARSGCELRVELGRKVGLTQRRQLFQRRMC